ncbi:MAG TPA: response regulator [Candidatus Nanoarchaeia archaeon]|nr:response regulator [Candidatus Nanoarchaeia archaeon]
MVNMAQSATLEQRLETKLILTQRQILTQVEEVAVELDIKKYTLLRMLRDKNYRVMVIDPNSETKGEIVGSLRNSNCIVTSAEPDKAENYLKSSKLWDAVLISFEQPENRPNGIEIAKKLKESDPDIPIVIYTSGTTEGIRNRSGEIYEALRKNFYGHGSINYFDYNFAASDSSTSYNLRDDKRQDLGIIINDSRDFKKVRADQVISHVRGSNILEDMTYQRRYASEGKKLSANAMMPKLYEHFFRVDLKHRIPILIKIGGSHFDIVEDGIDRDAIVYFTEYLTRFARENPWFAVIVCPGGGHLNDNIKDWLSNDKLKCSPGDRLIENIAMSILGIQADKLLTAFGKTNAVVMNPNNATDYEVITDDFFDAFPIMIWPYAPKEFRRTYQLSMAFSDAQTFATGALFDVQRALFSKNTNGIYTCDPNRLDFTEKGGTKLLNITCHDLREGKTKFGGREYELSRIGTDDRDGHLCESAGLGIMEELGIPRRTVVAHPRTQHLLERVFLYDDLIRMAGNKPDYSESLSSIVLKKRQRDKFLPLTDFGSS